MGVKYTSAAANPSGYGQAARNFIASLYIAGIDLTTEMVSQMIDNADYGWVGSLCASLQDRQIDYKIKFIHLTPDLYPKYMEKGKYHIGHLFFETDRLPKEWVNPCNQVDEIWTLSPQQAEMIKNSGVTVPIKCFPQPINTLYAETAIPPYRIPNFGGTIFYSIFQWIERKNPEALLKTYWKTFEGKNDVALVIKTYRVSYSQKEFEVLKADIKRWKQELGLTSYPRVFLVTRLLNAQEMFRLHQSGEIFISTSRGEGNGIPLVEASLMGKPVIYIDRTGVADIFPKDIYYPIPCTEEQAKQVHWIPWYTSEMKWYEINKEVLSKQMMECYNDRKEARDRGQRAKDWVKGNLNYWKIGQAMRERILEIERFL